MSCPNVDDFKADSTVKPIKDAPIVKNHRWLVNEDRSLLSVSTFFRKQIDVKEDEAIFFYVNQSFAPPLDVTIGTLSDTFSGGSQVLTLHYALTPAWG
ncbi:hypothetical protein GJ496_008051 [Pomphorhynchus laevis]|nr:hypothetical protein GJ496_008051 [Pomphorhynchus laevis]